MTAEQRRRELPKAIMKWYKIEQGSNVACIVAEEGNSSLIAEALEEDGRQVSRLAFAALENGQAEKRMGDSPYGKCQYDIIVAVDIIEYASDAAALLNRKGNCCLLRIIVWESDISAEIRTILQEKIMTASKTTGICLAGSVRA